MAAGGRILFSFSTFLSSSLSLTFLLIFGEEERESSPLWGEDGRVGRQEGGLPFPPGGGGCRKQG